MKCYKVKDPLRLGGTADLNTPQFGADAGCTVSKAKLFCVPATKTNVAVVDKTTGTPITPLPVSGPQPGDRLCYKVKCPNLPADQSVTDQFGNRTVAKLKASLVCTPAFKGSARYVDNGDGTVTDHYTGLQWDKKTNLDSTANFANPHDADNQYDWSTGTSKPDGSAYADFLYALNGGTSPDGTTTSGCFAGHCDWRLPTIEELASIADATQGLCGGGSGACIDPTFGPTPAGLYWSATTRVGFPTDAWSVYFLDGSVTDGPKTSNFYVRAVRGGS